MFFVFKQKTAYEMRIIDWSSDLCSSDLSSPCLITNAFCASVNFDAFIALRSIPSQENGTKNSNSLRGHFREADQGDKHDWQVRKAWSKTIAMGVVPPDFSNGAVAMLPIWASGRIRG